MSSPEYLAASREKERSTLACVFNQTLEEQGLPRVSERAVLDWMKADFPDTSIHPHKSDYCNLCAELKSSTRQLESRRGKCTWNANGDPHVPAVLSKVIYQVIQVQAGRPPSAGQ